MTRHCPHCQTLIGDSLVGSCSLCGGVLTEIINRVDFAGEVSQLYAMQDGFRRSTRTMRKMLAFVSAGGVYDAQTLGARNSGRTAPIVINRFEDGKHFVHDGLHRVASILRGRISGVLHESEYQIQELGYAKYREVNIHANYFTPFDPRTEVRVADFAEFKRRVRGIVADGDDPASFINQNRHLYVRTRQPHHDSIEKLVELFQPDLD